MDVLTEEDIELDALPWDSNEGEQLELDFGEENDER